MECDLDGLVRNLTADIRSLDPDTVNHTVFMVGEIARNLKEREAKVARLQAIVDKLPKCWRLVEGKLVQDVPVVPGMVLYRCRRAYRADGEAEWVFLSEEATYITAGGIMINEAGHPGVTQTWCADYCCSSELAARIAAEAAKEKADGH